MADNTFERKVLGPATAYAIAVKNGFEGTEAEWLASLEGKPGGVPALSVGEVATLNPGSKATVSITGTEEEPKLNFGIPTGAAGPTPQLSMGSVTTLEPGSNATATITGTAEKPVLNLGLPRGASGGIDVSGATVGQTIQVAAVDENGKPTEWIPVDFPSGSEMEIIATGELTEEAMLISIEVDNNGNPFELKEASFSIHVAESDANAAQGQMRLRTNSNTSASGSNGVYNNILGTTEGGRDVVFRFYQSDYISASAVATTGITTALGYINRMFATITALYLQGVTSESETFGVGTKWTLRGVRV